ncbi:hypothetical protein Tco_0758725 [Tanacetum coccineum]
MSYDLSFYTSSDDKDEVNSELALFTEACNAVIQASKQKISRNQVDRDRYGAHDRIVAAYFSQHPHYDEATLYTWFRMSRKLLTRIVQEITDHCPCFQLGVDCTGTFRTWFRICQMTYDSVPITLDGYLQIGATTTRESLEAFCRAVMELYGNEFLRKPAYTDIEKLYAHNKEKHGFPRIIRSLDCTG